MNFKELILNAENAEEVRSILAQMETELDGADEPLSPVDPVD